MVCKTWWVQGMISASLENGKVPPALKESVVHLLLKNTSLDPDVLNNYCLVTNISFWG